MKDVHLISGNGMGKTTKALGLALRMLGHDKKVVVVQFMKGWKNTGEYKFKNKNYKIFQFGRKGFVNLENPSVLDKKLAHEGLMFVKDKAYKLKPDLLILDEINVAVRYNLLDVKSVIDVVKLKPRKTVLVLTGRHAPKELKDLADFVTFIRTTKMNLKDYTQKGVIY